MVTFDVLVVTKTRKEELKNNVPKVGDVTNHLQNKEERYSRVPRLSDTRYSANGTKGKWRYASSKARLKCATYP